MRRLLTVLSAIVLLAACATNNPKYQLGDDYYRYRQPGEQYTKVFVDVKDDTIKIIPADNIAVPAVKDGIDQIFLRPSFDLDIMVTVFKYRPTALKFPRQLNTDFNGNLYFGYRVDRFKLDYTKTPAGTSKNIKHIAISAGIFTGLGSVAVTPWTTNQRTLDEYNGFALTRGFVFMFGVNNNTVGVGIGWDYLTDRDKGIWIYQNKPWYGLTFSINLN